jgi:hypothetical protein
MPPRRATPSCARDDTRREGQRAPPPLTRARARAAQGRVRLLEPHLGVPCAGRGRHVRLLLRHAVRRLLAHGPPPHPTPQAPHHARHRPRHRRRYRRRSAPPARCVGLPSLVPSDILPTALLLRRAVALMSRARQGPDALRHVVGRPTHAHLGPAISIVAAVGACVRSGR